MIDSDANRIDEAAKHYKKFCEAIGINLTKPDTKDTPLRVARLFVNEFTIGQSNTPPFTPTVFPIEEGQGNQLVIQTGIRFTSMCAHHHLPVVGRAHICYLPGKRLVGLSKLPRLVHWVAAQPSVQETIIGQIREKVVQYLQPRFVGVSIAARHECMACRGVREPDAITTTNHFWRCEADQHEDFSDTKDEFMTAITHWLSYQGRV